jgi:hypothetical protein
MDNEAPFIYQSVNKKGTERQQENFEDKLPENSHPLA